MTVNVETVDAVVVGGGFGGIRTIDLFKNRLGLDKVVGIEKGGALGGAWYWTQYPGAQTDTETWVFRFSDDRSVPNWNSRYLKAEQLQEQIHDTATKSGVAGQYIFNNSVEPHEAIFTHLIVYCCV
jgi:cation diffusion facilitator CzcD-associated flavoprotein CzcO